MSLINKAIYKISGLGPGKNKTVEEEAEYTRKDLKMLEQHVKSTLNKTSPYYKEALKMIKIERANLKR